MVWALYRVRQILFFRENALKKTLEFFLNFFYYLIVQSFRLIMENNFIHMAALAGHAVAYKIGPIFKRCISAMALRILSLKASIVSGLSGNTYLCGVAQIIVQRCQNAAPRWPNNISSAADNAVFKHSAQKHRM